MVIHGNILDITSGVIIHGCNSRGVMGSGLAKQIKITHPDAYYDYIKCYNFNGLTLGSIIISPVSSILDTNRLYIVNAITQKNYGRDPKIVYVDYLALAECFEKTLKWMNEEKLTQLYYPKIGAGQANGDWLIIHEIIKSKLKEYPEITGNLVIYEGN